jgi:hypothetical protein
LRKYPKNGSRSLRVIGGIKQIGVLEVFVFQGFDQKEVFVS